MAHIILGLLVSILLMQLYILRAIWTESLARDEQYMNLSNGVNKWSHEQFQQFKALWKRSDATSQLFQQHLNKVEEVIKATIPYMSGKEFTPANVAEAVKEATKDEEFNAELALQELEDFASGVNR